MGTVRAFRHQDRCPSSCTCCRSRGTIAGVHWHPRLASPHHRDEAGLQIEIHVSHIDLWPSGHVVSRGSSEFAEGLVSHSLEGWWRGNGWFLYRKSFLRSNDSRLEALKENFWIFLEIFQQVKTSHALPYFHNRSENNQG